MEFLSANWLGITGFVSGVLCVWLLIRENILTFPLGLLYAVVTVVVMTHNRLYADVLLNVYYVIMNAYGWYFWLYGGQRRREEERLLVAWVPVRLWVPAGLTLVAGTAIMGWYFDTQTDAALAYPDSFTTVTSFVAMWMSARKYMESWILWLVVNVISVALYLIKATEDPQLYFYAALYLIYVWMAVAGWRAWRVHTVPRPVTA